MVDCHGSQCGFCTPGFVMSLFALTSNGRRADAGEAAIDDALAGNLCRCTGYAPIVARGSRRMRERAEATRSSACARPTTLAAAARRWQDDETLAVGDGRPPLLSPRPPSTSWPSCCSSSPRRPILAGSTDVGLWVTKQMRRLDRSSMSAASRAAADRARRDDAHRDRRRRQPTRDAHGGAGGATIPTWARCGGASRSLQIRNAGTIGGNIANGSPIGDSPPVADRARRHAACCGAARERARAAARGLLPRLRQAGPRGRASSSRAVIVPQPAPGTRFRAYKISKRFDQDISAVCAAFRDAARRRARSPTARLAFGGMAATPEAGRQRRGGAGRPAPGPRRRVEAAMAALAQDFAPLTDMRASAGYRLRGRAEPAADASCRDRRAPARDPARRRPEPRPMSEPQSKAASATASASAARQRRAARHRRGALHRRHAGAGRPAARLARPVDQGARADRSASTSTRSAPLPAWSAC